jgi:hypothetical protein
MRKAVRIALYTAVGCAVLAMISVAAWKIYTTPACKPGYVLHTAYAYDYGLNPNGKFGFGLHPHTSCVPEN